MDILTKWLRAYLPELGVDDRQMAEDLTLRGVAVEGEFAAACGGALYEMDITTNRVDAMNHYGVAREAAAMYDVALKPLGEGAGAPVASADALVVPELESHLAKSKTATFANVVEYFISQRPLTTDEIYGEISRNYPSLCGFQMTSFGELQWVHDVRNAQQKLRRQHRAVLQNDLWVSAKSPNKFVRAEIRVRIEAEDLCGRFTARVIRGVSVGASTGLVAEYFAALGQKAISGPVDATNFGWLAMGQPTHVFDLDTLEGGIVVRRAKAGEKLRLLDGTERVLVAEDLVVADEVKALGLAGVMGGWDSRVTETTKNILVEAAWFEPAAIRASSRRHGLHTDASHRFERGADFDAAPVANHLVTRLVMEQSGGEVVGPLVDVVVPEVQARTAKRSPITLRVSEVKRLLGTTADGLGISAAVVKQYLTALGCAMEDVADGDLGGEYSVTLPSWRLDLEREIDLIEEVARVYGYNRFADTLPGSAGAVKEQPHAEQERVIRETLRGLGFAEAVSSTFTSAAEAEVFGEAGLGAVAMGNPLSAEAGMLRPSLIPGMATMLALNLHRDVSAVRLFEMGTVFTGSVVSVTERVGLSVGATGDARASSLYKVEDALFYEVKGALETLLAPFVGVVTFEAAGLPVWMAAGRGAKALLDEKTVAVFGELSAAELQARKLRQGCVIANVDSHLLLGTALKQPVVKELSRYQAVERDFSFTFADEVRWGAIEAAVRGLAIAEIKKVVPVEIFRDAKRVAGSYSLLVRVVFQSGERTLTEEELTGWSAAVVGRLVELGGVQRA